MISVGFSQLYKSTLTFKKKNIICLTVFEKNIEVETASGWFYSVCTPIIAPYNIIVPILLGYSQIIGALTAMTGILYWELFQTQDLIMFMCYKLLLNTFDPPIADSSVFRIQ